MTALSPRLATTAASVLAALALPASAAAATEEAKPAGGAAVAEVITATAGAVVITLALLALGWAHRTGRVTFLKRAADGLAKGQGLPPWAALPSMVVSISLLTALFGMYWDISLHIDDGRDPGPLANPAHYFILIGLFGVFAGGFLATVLPEGRPSPSAVRITGDWYAPVGGLALLACSAFALSGFPLDDGWHRLFGQDVTLWGPTHLMLIGGAGLSLIGYAMLMVEGRESAPRGAYARGLLAKLAKHRLSALAGGFLVGLSTFQGEFDFGVPQFRLLFHPVLIALAAGIALTVARIYSGPGAALWAAVYFLIIRGGVALLVGPVLGETTPYFPLYLGEAALVELAALLVRIDRPYRFGAVAGALIGSVGFATEFLWSKVFFPVEWPSRLMGEAALVVPLTGVAAGLIGAYIGSALRAPRAPSEVRMPRIAPAAGGLAVLVAVVAFGLNTEPAEDVRASVTLRDTAPPPERSVQATVRVDPPSAARDADWLSAIAWQGGDLVVNDLEEMGPGVYRTTEPLPVHGNWKAMIRLHRERSIVAAPVYLPEDPAIPAAGVPASARFERTFAPDKEILQREQKDDVSGALPSLAYGAVGAIALTLMLVLGWALARLGRVATGGPPRRARRRGAPRPVAHGGAA